MYASPIEDTLAASICFRRLRLEQRGHEPFAKGEIGRDDDRGAFIEPADQVEEQLPARLSR